jgi:hypothetical protein
MILLKDLLFESESGKEDKYRPAALDTKSLAKAIEDVALRAGREWSAQRRAIMQMVGPNVDWAQVWRDFDKWYHLSQDYEDNEEDEEGEYPNPAKSPLEDQWLKIAKLVKQYS